MTFIPINYCIDCLRTGKITDQVILHKLKSNKMLQCYSFVLESYVIVL